MPCENISPRKMDYYVGNPYARIIDLRDEKDYNCQHIKKAVNIPYNIMESAINNIFNNHSKIRIKGVEYDKNVIMVFYCTRGAQSIMICSRLSNFGFNCKSLVGGINHYNGKNLVKEQ